MADDIKLRVALKAVVVNDEGKMLVLREAGSYAEGTNLGKYDVPGGRLEPGEVWSEGLLREVREETGLEVDAVRPISVGEWRPVIQGVQNQIVGIFIVCRPKQRENSIQLDAEHDQYEWIGPDDLDKYPLLAATRTAAQALFSL